MLKSNFKLNLLTPEKKVIVDLDILEVTVPLKSGEVDILPGHVPVVSILGTGVLKYKTKDNSSLQKAVISSGYCEISPEGVSILAESIQMKDDVQENLAKESIKKAETNLATVALTDEEFEANLVAAQKGRAGLQLLN